MRNLMLCWLCGFGLTAVVVAQDGAADYLPSGPLHDANLQKYWQLQLPLEAGQTLSGVELVDDTLYLGTNDGYVYAVDAITGVVRWLQPIYRSGYTLRRPTHTGSAVIFVTPTDLQYYNRRSGEGLRRVALRFPPGSAIVSDGPRAYIGGLDGRLYTYDVATGFVAWRLYTGTPLISTPAMWGDFVYSASDSGQISAAVRTDKSFGWLSRVYGSVTADLVAAQQGVFVACEDFSLYLLDHGFGEIRWRARLSSALHDAPLVTEDTAYQFALEDGLAAIETAIVGVDERIRWKAADAGRALLVHDGVVTALLRKNGLIALNAKDGAVVATIPAKGFAMGVGDATLNAVYAVAGDGRVFCARPLNVPLLTLEAIAAAQRPPGAEGEAATSQPAAVPPAETPNLLESQQSGRPLGGKSKVSKEYGER